MQTRAAFDIACACDALYFDCNGKEAKVQQGDVAAFVAACWYYMGDAVALAAAGILGGYDLSPDFPELGHALLVCATELRTTDDIAAYRHALAGVFGVAVAA